MATFAAEDFSFIRKRMREIKPEPPPEPTGDGDRALTFDEFVEDVLNPAVDSLLRGGAPPPAPPSSGVGRPWWANLPDQEDDEAGDDDPDDAWRYLTTP